MEEPQDESKNDGKE